MRLSEHLIVSDPAKESEWRQIVERRLKEPALYVVCIPKQRIYPAEILSTREYYKNEDGYEVIGLADSESAAVRLVRTAVETVLPADPKLEHLKPKLREIYL